VQNQGRRTPKGQARNASQATQGQARPPKATPLGTGPAKAKLRLQAVTLTGVLLFCLSGRATWRRDSLVLQLNKHRKADWDEDWLNSSAQPGLNYERNQP